MKQNLPLPRVGFTDVLTFLIIFFSLHKQHQLNKYVTNNFIQQFLFKELIVANRRNLYFFTHYNALITQNKNVYILSSLKDAFSYCFFPRFYTLYLKRQDLGQLFVALVLHTSRTLSRCLKCYRNTLRTKMLWN